MALIPYITTGRMKAAMRSSYNGIDDISVLPYIIESCCAFLDKYTQRASGAFTPGGQVYDELYSGGGERLLYLNNYPVISVSRVSTVTLPCVSILNNDPDMGARALSQIIGVPQNPNNLNSQYTSTGLVLTYIKNAVTQVNTFLWTDYPTVNALVAAINLVGNHWTAQSMGGFGGWSTTDLRATQGNYGSRITTSYLWLHWQDLPWFRVNENIGEIYSPMGFARGQFNYRVVYTAGWSALPLDIEQALAELCAATYYAREINANTASESLGPYSYSQLSEKSFEGLSLVAKKTFQAYKSQKLSKFSLW